MVIGRVTAELAVRAHGAERRRTMDHSKRFAWKMLAAIHFPPALSPRSVTGG
jgi:hypothetical protein